MDHKLGVVRTQFYRANTIISNLDDRESEHAHLKGALGRCGYSGWVFQKALRPKTPRTNDQNTRSTVSSQRVNVVLPYIQGTAEKVKRILMKQGISVSFKPPNTLRSRFVHTKDQISKDHKSDVI